MKESKGFKMVNEEHLSFIGRLNERLINFHKDILKNYLRPLGADSLGFLESYFGLRMFRSPMVEMLNIPEVEMVYLIQPMMNTLTSSAVKTVKSEIFTRRKEIFFGRDKFDLTTPKAPVLLDHISFPALQESKMADTDFNMPVFLQKKPIIPSFNTNTHNLEQVHMHSHGGTSLATNTVTPNPFPIAADIFLSLFKMQHRRPAFFSGDTVINGAKDNLNKWERSTRIYHGRPPEAHPIFHLERSSLRMHKFIPIIDTQHTRIKEDALSDEHASLSPPIIFADRHHNSSRSFEVMRVKEDTNSREGVRPIGFESSGLIAPAQHSVDYELIADRVYDIIENRLRIESERE